MQSCELVDSVFPVKKIKTAEDSLISTLSNFSTQFFPIASKTWHPVGEPFVIDYCSIDC